MLVDDLVLGPVTGTYYCLFQKEISKIPTVTPSLFHQNHRFSRHNVSATKYKSVIKMSTTGRQPVVFVVLLFYVHGKHLRSCRDGQLT